MIKLILILVGLSGQVSIPEQPLWKAYEKQVGKELAKWSGSFDKTEFIKTSETREFYRILNRTGEETGTLVLTSAQGRFDRFDLMVVIDLNGRINLIKILKYRSEFGSEVTNKSWLSQFYVAPEHGFELHKNIDAISGATYSSHGLVDEINAILR